MNAFFQQALAYARRYPLVVTSFLLVAVLSGTNYVLWQERTKITAEHEAVRRNGEAMMFALSGQSRITTELATVQEALKSIDRNLIVEGDLAENLGYFYEMETQCRVRLAPLNQLSSQPSPEGNPYKAIPFSLRVTGTYVQVMNFVHQLETGPRLVRIRTYSFTRGDQKTNTLSVDLVLDILGSS